MPFAPPFRTIMEDGDLIYGIHRWRVHLLMHLTGGNLDDRDLLINILDQYKLDAVNALRRNDRRALGSFLRANLQHPSYRRYGWMLKQNSPQGRIADDQAVLRAENLGDGNRGRELENSAFRAKSKFGLYWTIQNQRGHIHFILNGLNMHQVSTKSFPGEYRHTRRRKYRSYTGSELRWIYRHRNIPEVAARVQFWYCRNEQNGDWRPVGPPWDNAVRTDQTANGPQNWMVSWQQYIPSQNDYAL